jgi:hypothetical protein
MANESSESYRKALQNSVYNGNSKAEDRLIWVDILLELQNISEALNELKKGGNA